MNRIMSSLWFVMLIPFVGFCGDMQKSPLPCQTNDPQRIIDETNAVEQTESAGEIVQHWLREQGLAQGGNASSGRIVSIGVNHLTVGEEPFYDEIIEARERYDIPYEPNDDLDTRRFTAMWKAYADGIVSIARTMRHRAGMEMEIKDFVDEGGVNSANGDNGHRKMFSGEMRVRGLNFLTMAESIQDEEGPSGITYSWCQIAVALSAMEKSGGESASLYEGVRPSPLSLTEWIEKNSKDGMICPQVFFDKDGMMWRVAGMSVAVDGIRNMDKVMCAKRRAKIYTFEAALRTVDVVVSFSRMYSCEDDKNDTDSKLPSIGEELRRDVIVAPVLNVSSADSSRVKWYEVCRKKAGTDRVVCLVVCAISDKPCK